MGTASLDSLAHPCLYRSRLPFRALLALLVLAAGSAAAGEAPRDVASPSLPWNHWAVRAVERLDALGLVADWLPAQREVPLIAVALALDEADQRAPTEWPAMSALVAAWNGRLHDEWPGAFLPPYELRFLGGQASASFVARDRSGTATTSGLNPGALVQLAPSTQGELEILAAAAAGPHLAALAAPRLAGSDLNLSRDEMVLGAGAWRLSVGQAPVRYGYAESGAVIFSGRAPLDRIEISTARPVRLPWVLSALGPFSAHGFVAWLHEPRHPYHPFLGGLRFQLRPHPRLALSVQRGVMFGGSRWGDHDLGSVLGTIIGARNGSENNVLSVAARWNLPTDAWLPVTLYGEWGGDDNGGAWFQVPGMVFGLSLPALPGLPEVSAGFELSYFGRLYRRDITWYAHGNYFGGWAIGQTPLGHALGGNGREYRWYASADLLEARLDLHGAAFIRERFSGNLYAPDWIGLSRGFEVEGVYRLTQWIDVELSGDYECGADWSAGRLFAGGRFHF